MRQRELREFESTDEPVDLSIEEIRALERYGSKLSISPSVEKPGAYHLTASSWVGAIFLPTLAVIIRPKLPISRLLFLLSYSIDPRHWPSIRADFREDASVFEAVIPGFVLQVRQAIAQGILQNYRVEDAALSTIRGRVRFDDQVRSRFGIAPPVEVRYDEFTEDIEENRLIKAAIDRLGLLPLRSTGVRQSLRAFDSVLEMVQLVAYDPRLLPTITYTRLNERYRSTVELARLILRSVSFDLWHGHVGSTAFLLDMSHVFEDFVVVALREALDVSDRVFRHEDATLRLDRQGAIPLVPDLSWWDGKRCTFVGDAKYKRIKVSGILHPDIYQLLAYTVAANLPGGMLIYAAGADEHHEVVEHTVVHVGKHLEVQAIDLKGSPRRILKDIEHIAQRIKSTVESASTGTV